MKNLKLILFLPVLLNFTIQSSGQDVSTHRKELAALKYFSGSWKGTATIQQPGGKMLTLNQEEKITWELDSLLLKIEGIGTDPTTQKKSFHAMAMVSYNPLTQQLGLRSYTHEGRQTDAYFKVIGANQFEWGFELPANRGKIRYFITLSEKDKTWVEKGEYSPDGNQWMPFISMNLTKQ